MIEKIDRYYLEIGSIENQKSKKKPSDKISLELSDRKNFELNKFLYKQIGKKHQWIDRRAAPQRITSKGHTQINNKQLRQIQPIHRRYLIITHTGIVLINKHASYSEKKDTKHRLSHLRARIIRVILITETRPTKVKKR